MVVVVVVVVVVSFEEVRVNVELGVQVKAAQIKHIGQRYFAKMHDFLWRARIHVGQAVLQVSQGLRRHQFRLADEQLVGKTDLPTRLLPIVELRVGMLGVDQSQNRVQQIALGDFLVHEKCLRHRPRIRQARGLNHHTLKIEQAFALFGGQQLQGFAQVLTNRTANAAIAHLDDVFLGVIHQNFVVDVFFAKFIFDDRDFLTVGFSQNAFEQGGFAGTQKASKDGDGNQSHSSAPVKLNKTKNRVYPPDQGQIF